jgi:hypothetical protein
MQQGMSLAFHQMLKLLGGVLAIQDTYSQLS